METCKWGLRCCDNLLKKDGRTLFHSPNVTVFSISVPIIRRNWVLWLFIRQIIDVDHTFWITENQTITFPADMTVFTCFRAGSSGETHCFDFYFGVWFVLAESYLRAFDAYITYGHTLPEITPYINIFNELLTEN